MKTRRNLEDKEKAKAKKPKGGETLGDMKIRIRDLMRSIEIAPGKR